MIKLDNKFFKSLKYRWLKSNEIYYLLINIEKLLSSNIVKLSFSPQEKAESYNLNYFKMESFSYFLQKI